MQNKLILIFIIMINTACSTVNNSKKLESILNNVQTMTVNNEKRDWRIFVPSSYVKGKPIPLVLDFHGTGSSPKSQAALSAFEPLAEREGFIVVTPAAKYILANGRVAWNADQNQDGVDDVEFIRQLIAYLKQNYSVDATQIYAAGMSGGARMSSRLGCDLSDVVAAIGAVAGLRFPEDCKPLRSVPLIGFHGKQDKVNHYVHQDNSPSYWRYGVEEALESWKRNNQCEAIADEKNITPKVTRLSFQQCQQQGDIVFYRSKDAGHTWPGSPNADLLAKYGLGKTDKDIPATELIWAFFMAHPLP